jgi:hypothetical protein
MEVLFEHFATEGEMNMSASNYLVIQDWMIEELKLKGMDLIIYAIIFGFSQGEKSGFVGSQKYLAFWCNSSIRGVQKSLNKLTQNGLIYKSDSGLRTRSLDELSSLKSEQSSCEQDELCSEKDELCSEKDELSSPNNIDNTFILKEKINKKEKLDADDDEKKRFKIPSVIEIASYCRKRNNTVDAQRFFDFYESKGWMIGKNKMKDWKAAVRTWENQERKRRKSNDTLPYV